MYKLAVVASHPIQYQAPWFRALAVATNLTVFYCHRQDPSDHARTDFGVAFEWDIPLLEGYNYRWLHNRSSRPDVSTFRGCDTPEIAGILTRGAYDVCVVSGWYLKSYIQAIRASRRAGIPVLVRGDSQLATKRSPLASTAKYFPYRWFLQRIDGHLYVGTANREYLRHYGVDDTQLFFVPHAVDNGFFARRAREARETGAASRLRGTIGAEPNSNVFILVGKLVDGKRPADFVRALAVARAQGIDARGIIIGSGPLAIELESLARRLDIPVFFAGFRNQTELPSFLAAADALVLPSASETWGLVVNEAMACGLPAIVSSAVGCATDLVEEDRTGYTFDVGDVDAIARAMGAVANRRRIDAMPFREAVDARIDHYSVAAAVEGTVGAIAAVVKQSGLDSIGDKPSDQQRYGTVRSL
jgi:glycosyltransferase involved in cell wall biosynthesis